MWLVGRPLVPHDQVDSALAGTGWAREDDEIATVVTLSGFREAIAFVNAVADVAEELNHHPDMTVQWNRVGLRVSTHDSGGLTELDLQLAGRVDALRPPAE
jgi:4a-hydroxytetrahydrobiopterin dehydratase